MKKNNNRKMETLKEKSRYEGMNQGICIAIAHLLREGYISVAADIWRGAGLTIEECQEVVDVYDMYEIAKYQKELI